MYIYYPSCNFTKNFPDTAKKLREYMKTQPDVKVAGCCHVTGELPKEGDIIVTVCMSCMVLLEERRPDVQQISLFEFLLTRKDFPWPDKKGEKFALQDCFRARGKHELHEAVRECMAKMGCEVIECPPSRDEATYDGSFLLHEAYPQCVEEAPKYFVDYLTPHITVMPKEEWPQVFRQRVAELPDKKVVTYCNVCTSSLKEGGAEAYHLAEILFE